MLSVPQFGLIPTSTVQIQLRPLWQTPPGAVHSSADTSRCSSGPCTVDTSRNCTGLYSADTSRCSSGPCSVDTSRHSTLLCSADTSRCSSGPCSVDTSRNCTGLYSVNDKVIDAKRSESFENVVFFNIEAKRTRSIVV
jgi:hypothetical protein